jgi:hypothetical protein
VQDLLCCSEQYKGFVDQSTASKSRMVIFVQDTCLRCLVLQLPGHFLPLPGQLLTLPGHPMPGHPMRLSCHPMPGHPMRLPDQILQLTRRSHPQRVRMNASRLTALPLSC